MKKEKSHESITQLKLRKEQTNLKSLINSINDIIF